jgi:hypothetical protein
VCGGETGVRTHAGAAAGAARATRERGCCVGAGGADAFVPVKQVLVYQ